jgi:hypothetical protein
MLFKGYIDESYNTQLFTLSCLMSDHWAFIESDWKRFSEIKISLCESRADSNSLDTTQPTAVRKGEFKGWTVKEQVEFAKRLIAIFKKHFVNVIAYSMPLDEFVRVFPECKDDPVLVQPEMEKRRSPLVSIPPFGRGFSRHGVFRSDGGWAAQERALTRPFIVSMSPPGNPSAWLRPRSARFRFARQNHCNSATSCRFSTSGLPVTPPEPRPARPES